eukprot:tig00020710_g13280.t1
MALLSPAHDPRLTKSAEYAPSALSATFYNPLLAAKRSREQAEVDVQLLENRLRRLRVETERSERAVEHTRKRANEILSLKERNEERRAAKARLQELEEMERRRKAEMLLKAKAETRAQREAMVSSMLQSRRAEAAESKRASAEYDQSAERFREMERRRAALMRHSIRQREVEAQARTQRLRQRHETALLEDWGHRLALEEERRRRAQEVASRMEQEEAELLEKLRAVQAKQRAAYVELEGALRASSPLGLGTGSAASSERGSATAAGAMRSAATAPAGARRHPQQPQQQQQPYSPSSSTSSPHALSFIDRELARTQ